MKTVLAAGSMSARRLAIFLNPKARKAQRKPLRQREATVPRSAPSAWTIGGCPSTREVVRRRARRTG